jgi:RNA-directed DNA polymerase
MALHSRIFIMKRHGNLYQNLCSYESLEIAFRKARKRKTLKPYVLDFEKNLKNNLMELRTELLLHSYRPEPLKTFIVRDPKTRKISKSAFKDRVVHHALCNIIEPIFEKTFIHDSYANRKGKGTLKAVQRFDFFKRKVSRNNTVKCYVLKADIRKYFENVNHEVLLDIISNKIKDSKVIRLAGIILANYNSKEKGVGMPLGNLTSQFFANIYLNELDQFVKNELKAEFYIRYVDDFVILNGNREFLEKCRYSIDRFLNEKLKIYLHPEKSKIFCLKQPIAFLGYRIFYHHKLLKKSNYRKFCRTFKEKLSEQSLSGWLGYAMWANTYNLRRKFMMN